MTTSTTERYSRKDVNAKYLRHRTMFGLGLLLLWKAREHSCYSDKESKQCFMNILCRPRGTNKWFSGMGQWTVLILSFYASKAENALRVHWQFGSISILINIYKRCKYYRITQKHRKKLPMLEKRIAILPRATIVTFLISRGFGGWEISSLSFVAVTRHSPVLTAFVIISSIWKWKV